MTEQTKDIEVIINNDGSILEDGYVYIGKPGLEPIANPLAVYKDYECNYEVEQPVRTINGYTVVDGNPTKLYTKQDYSITVKTSIGLNVYTKLNSSDCNVAFVNTIITSLVTGGFMSVFDFGAVGDGITDDTQAFVDAFASGKKIIVPGNGYSYAVTGGAPILNGTSIESVGLPTILLTLDNSAHEGFDFTQSGGAWLGTTYIQTECTVTNTDGSKLNTIKIGDFLYGATTPTKIDNIRLGTFIIDSVGTQVTKGLGIYGYVEDVEYDTFIVDGVCTRAVVHHWGRDGTDPGVLPTKTWHPHNIRGNHIENKTSYPNAFAFFNSATGSVKINRVVGASERNFQHFCGDYGGSYSQNLEQNQLMQLTVGELWADNPSDFGVSVDGYSSGLLGSPVWNGCDHAASLHIKKLKCRLAPSGSNPNACAVSGLKTFIIDEIDVFEENDDNTNNILELFGVDYAKISGEARSMKGLLVRNCGEVDLSGLRNVCAFPDPAGTQYGLSVSATSADIVTTADVDVGDTQIELGAFSASGLVAKGYIQYTTGGVTYDIPMTTTSDAAASSQTVGIEPSPVAIASGQTVKIIQTTKSVIVPHETSGFSHNCRTTGSSTARVKHIDLHHTKSLYSGARDFDLDNVEHITGNPFIDHGGKRSGNTNRGLAIGADVLFCDIESVYCGKNNQGLQYPVFVDNAALGRIGRYNVQSYNGSASNPAAIFRQSSLVEIGGGQIASGLTRFYPSAMPTFTPVFSGSTDAGTPTGTFTGYWYPTGDMVDVEARGTFTAITGMTGNLIMSGLPFTVVNLTSARFAISVAYTNGKTTTGDVIMGYCAANTDTIVFYKKENNTPLAISDLTGTFNFYFSGRFMRK